MMTAHIPVRRLLGTSRRWMSLLFTATSSLTIESVGRAPWKRRLRMDGTAARQPTNAIARLSAVSRQSPSPPALGFLPFAPTAN
ncbi:hypothetical protein VTJ04DRAFT_3321 [Mycothermus thermophilus]|uniref:uncharacterized protein n=1 Tax=Humicola insolens TaxID=85995 RepID=UPI00374299F7